MASMVIETGSETSVDNPVWATTERFVARPRTPMAAVTVTSTTTCSCGQALECCHTAHCPRCGITLPD